MAMKYLILLVTAMLGHGVFAQVTVSWKTETVLEVPESVMYYADGNCLFVSNIVGKPSDKDGIGFISKLSLTGEVSKLKWIEGLDAPKGMAIKDGVLYVSNINELVLIDIASAKVIKKILQPNARFLNDVTITHLGDVLVSDTSTSTVYILNGDQLDVWLKNEDFGRVNGLFAENDYILLGTASSIVKIDVATKVHRVFLETGGQPDGIEADGEGGYYYSFWRGELFHFIPGEEPKQLLNTSNDNVQCADIGFNPATKEILVPTFFSNQVVAYTMD
jgi:DNA-binding beta-propeller fold protein YncE